MKITYLSHSCVLIESGENRLIIDPFLSANDKAPVSPEEIKVDYILLTHGHNDHVGDTADIARANEATIIANFEIADYFGSKGLKTHGMYHGGAYGFPFGRVKFTIAHHGSSLQTAEGRIAMGNPAGLLLTVEGKTLYHAGDTGLFLDMKLIGEMHPIEVAFLPVGDNFTMGIDEAARAVSFLNPKLVVPVHYDTWPIIAADTNEFSRKVTEAGAEPKVMKPGESFEL